MKRKELLCVTVLLCAAMCLGVCGFAQAEGYTQVIPLRYDWAGDFSEGLAMVRVGDNITGKYGFVDKAGNEVVPLKYDDARQFSDGVAIVKLGGRDAGKSGFIDQAGNEVVPCQYDYISSCGDGVMAVKLGEKWGLLDTMGNEIMPCAYDCIAPFSQGVVLVELDGKQGFMDGAGNEVTPRKYDYVRELRDGLARVGISDDNGGLYGFVDAAGQEVIPCQYRRIGAGGDWQWPSTDGDTFSEGLASAWLPGDREGENDEETVGEWGVIDQAGKVIVPFELEYDDAGYFHEGLMAVMDMDRDRYHVEVGAKDEAGDAEDDEEYDEDYEDYEDDADHEMTYYAKVGFIDTTGELVIPLMYICPYYAGNGCLEAEYILPEFSEGLAAVMNDDRQENKYNLSNNGKFGYIDKAGNVVIPFVYDYAAPFSEGLAYVCQGEKYGYIDTTGKIVVPLDNTCDYDLGCDSEGGRLDEQRFSDGFARISKGESGTGPQYGLVDKKGGIVIPPQYDWVDWDSHTLATLYAGEYPHDYNAIGFAFLSGERTLLIDTYKNVDAFCEGLASVSHSREGVSKMGYIDTTGQEVVPCIFDCAGDFSDGMAVVQKAEKWGYIAMNQ